MTDRPCASAELIQQARDFCSTLSEADDALAREMVTRVADKWSLWILDVLTAAGGPMRFSRVREQVEGISQKSLTKTLRQLERDGLATRTMYLEVPPRVEYAITPLGLDLLAHVMPLWIWVAESISRFQNARQSFDTGRQRPAANEPLRTLN